jgi:hypothetical protein
MTSSGDDAEDLSSLAHRRVIGLLGLGLPWLVLLLAAIRPTAGLPGGTVLDSVSAYYYTGAVGVFVGVLFALSLFLFTYRGYELVDRIVGGIGGAAAVFVALCPTDAPDGLLPPSWWSPATGKLHYVAAVTLFLSFIVFSIWLFRKSKIPKRGDRPVDKRRRDDVCLVCGLVMIVAVGWAGLNGLAGRAIFLPEAIAIEAFAISWLAKGEIHKVWSDGGARG